MTMPLLTAEPDFLRVFIVDDHPMFRNAVGEWLAQEPRYRVCGEAKTAPEALDALRAEPADIVILDISLQGSDGLELIKHLRTEQPGARILVLSMHDENTYAARALRAGAQGYMMKSESGETFLQALDQIGRGETYVSPDFRERLIYQTSFSGDGTEDPLRCLSDRELEVLKWVGSGISSREIAHRLHLSIKTIESHRLHLKQKLRLRSSPELVRFAREWVRTDTTGTREVASV